jgi:lipopolysaccharide/colanic/teichoic acid biosynthesis glycosyltransferase
MRILLIHQAFVSPSEAGGTRHYELARHLIEQGHSFSIVASDLSYLTGQRAISQGGLVTEQDIDGVRVLRAYTYPSLHRSFIWRVFSFLSFMLTSVGAALKAGPVDLVMGTSPPIFQAVSAWLVAFLRRRPFLLEIRDLWPAFAIDMGVLRNPGLIWLSRMLERFLYARATHILVNSPAYRDYLIERHIPAERISLIANGVDIEMFSSNGKGDAIRQEFGLTGKCVVTYAGALGLANDIPTLLRAAERVRDHADIHFLLVGDGKERPTLEAFVRERGLQNITFVGSRPKTDMPAFLAASDACVAILQNIPMFRTTYPNKVFDYMAAERPTLVVIDGVIREVIEKADGGIFVPPGDDAALARAVLSLRDDPQRRQAMGASARTYVTKHFNRQQQAVQFTQLLQRFAMTRSNDEHVGKRLLDVLIPCLVLLAAFPLLVCIALLVRFLFGSPILFRQQRPGLHGRPFTMCKFRTMTDARDAQGNLLPDDERLTPFGRFLRSTSLDELPELFNVLKGDMSLVGPRPLLMQYLERYTPEQMRRHEVKPGMTGWAQVNGRNAISWEDKFALDVWYVDHQSFWLDLKILALTAWKMLKREGINQPGQATADEFMGSRS